MKMFKFPLYVQRVIEKADDNTIRKTYDNDIVSFVAITIMKEYLQPDLYSFDRDYVIEYKEIDKYNFEFFFVTSKHIAIPAIMNELDKNTDMEILENFYPYFKEVLGEVKYIIQLPVLKTDKAVLCPETHLWGYESMMKTYDLYFGFTPDEAIPYQFFNRIAFDALIGYVYGRDDGFLVCSSCFRAFPKRSALIDSYNENLFDANYCTECHSKQIQGVK